MHVPDSEILYEYTPENHVRRDRHFFGRYMRSIINRKPKYFRLILVSIGKYDRANFVEMAL